MKFLISAVVVIGLAVGAWKFWNYYNQFRDKAAASVTATQTDTPNLPGLPPSLEAELAAAQQHGALALRNFLKKYSRVIRDPRLASIELNYVVLIASSDIAEARRVFAQVKTRTPKNSPVYNRIAALEKTYE